MKKKIALEWADALRSGDYKQGTDTLRTEKNEFCCLGVLCNLHAQKHPKFAATQTNPREYAGDINVTPLIVMNWSGLKSDDGDLPNKDTLTELNDNGYTFEQIADIIEKNWKSL